MSLRRKKEFFADLEKKPFSCFMDEYLKIYYDLQVLIEKSHAKNKIGGPAARYNVNLHYKIRQGTLTLEKLGAMFRARTIKMEKDHKEGLNYDQ